MSRKERKPYIFALLVVCAILVVAGCDPPRATVERQAQAVTEAVERRAGFPEVPEGAIVVRLWECNYGEAWVYDREKCPRKGNTHPSLFDKIYQRYPGSKIYWVSPRQDNAEKAWVYVYLRPKL